MISRVEIVGRALQHLGHREATPNRSPLIDGWIRRCGLDPGGAWPWCAAFASWCVEERWLGVESVPPVGLVREPGALKLLALFPACKIPLPGDLMGFPTGNGAGHVGVVEDVDDTRALCIEGNSADGIRRVIRLRSEVQFARTREIGGAVYRHHPGPWPDAPLVHPAKAGTR